MCLDSCTESTPSHVLSCLVFLLVLLGLFSTRTVYTWAVCSVIVRVNTASGASSSWWNHRTVSSHVGTEVQLRQDDLSQVIQNMVPYGSS